MYEWPAAALPVLAAVAPFDLAVAPPLTPTVPGSVSVTPLADLASAAVAVSEETTAAGGGSGTRLLTLIAEFEWLERVVTTATGWGGLVIVFVYSFLIAFALPGVSEIVLLAPLDLGTSESVTLALIILVSGVGKAVGSVFAFHIGQEAKQSGPVIRFLRRSRFDIVAWSEARTVELARKYGFGGLAAALCVPGFPDTISIYAFAVLERDYYRFALATFVGSVGRLLLWLGGVHAFDFVVALHLLG